MKTLNILRLEAEDSAVWRGHMLGIWKAVILANGHIISRAICHNCNAYVDVDENPPPNGIDVGGTAVALNCPISEED